MKTFQKTVAIVAVAVTLTTGCRSLDEYKTLGEAGNKYADAVDQLLVTAGTYRINATSEQILESKRNLDLDSIRLEHYEGRSQTDEEFIQIINELRKHNQLLQAYFDKLQELANSDAPEKAAIETEGIVKSLETSGNILLGTGKIPNQGVLAAVTELALNSQIRGALREELETRKPTILKELTIQEKMLEYIATELQASVAEIKRLQEERLLINPFINEPRIEDEDKWIKTRHDILTMEMEIAKLYKASAALGEFKEIFQSFLQGKMNLGNLKDFLQHITPVIASVDTNK